MHAKWGNVFTNLYTCLLHVVWEARQQITNAQNKQQSEIVKHTVQCY